MPSLQSAGLSAVTTGTLPVYSEYRTRRETGPGQAGRSRLLRYTLSHGGDHQGRGCHRHTLSQGAVMLAALLRLRFQAALLVLLALAALTFLSYVKVGHIVFCSHSRYLRSTTRPAYLGTCGLSKLVGWLVDL